MVRRRNILGIGLAWFTMALPLCAQTATGPAARPRAKSPIGWVSMNAESPVMPGAKLRKLADGFAFTEGPTSDEAGNIFFIDQPNDRIMLWSVEEKLTTWMQPSGHSNGMCFDAAGNLISCADEKNELWSIAPDKKVTVLVTAYKDKLLNGPNDVWVRPDGGMYLTDPFYKRDWWPKDRSPGMEQDVQGVYFLSPDHKTLTRVIDDFRQPNGIIGTPDGKMIYVSDIRDGKTFSYTINTNGTLSDKKLFCNIGSDGMTIDSEGNIYTSSRGALQISDKNGKLLDVLPVNAANVCFGGTDGHLLFITARKEIYGIQMRTHRVGPQ